MRPSWWNLGQKAAVATPLRGEDLSLRGRIFRWGGRIFGWAPKIVAMSDSYKTLHGESHGHAQQQKNAKTRYWSISSKDDLVSRVSLLRGEDFPLRGEIFHWGGRIFCWEGGGGVEICCSHILWSLTLCFWPDSESTKLLHHTQQKWPVKTIGVFVFVLHPWVHLTNKRKLKVDNHKIILNILYIEIKTFNAPGQFSRKNLILFLQFLPDFQCSNIFAVTWTYAEPIFLR
jgi:hypothetical protein